MLTEIQIIDEPVGLDRIGSTVVFRETELYGDRELWGLVTMGLGGWGRDYSVKDQATSKRPTSESELLLTGSTKTLNIKNSTQNLLGYKIKLLNRSDAALE